MKQLLRKLRTPGSTFPSLKEMTRRVRHIRGLAMIVCLLQACSPPKGPDLVDVRCMCHDSGSGSFILLDGRVCTTASNPDAVKDATQSLCDGKETKCYPSCVAKIEDCVPVFTSATGEGCPNGSSERAGGDFGQASATAVAPSKVNISGDDIEPFAAVPEKLTARTTQTGATLLFADLEGVLADITFESAGIFGSNEHTLTQGRIFLTEAFSVPLQPDSSYVIPPGMASFIVTGVLDGDRVALKGTTKEMTGLYDEEIGLFDLSGTVQTEGADITLKVNITFHFDNRPPRANAGPDQTVECSSTAQLGHAHLSGAASTDFDGDDDIQHFSWFVDPSTPGARVAVGEEVDVDLSLGTHVATLAVGDRAGSFSEDSVAILVQDTTAPVIGITQPAPTEYVHSATLTLNYTVDDACTGVHHFTPLMDNASTLAGHGLQSGQAINLLTELPLGPHTFRINAVDNTGNVSSSSVTFTIIVTPESIKADVRQFLAAGAIKNEGLANSLLAKLNTAASARASGNCAAAANIYQAFINELQAQSSKGVDAAAASIMIADAQYLIAHCS